MGLPSSPSFVQFTWIVQTIQKNEVSERFKIIAEDIDWRGLSLKIIDITIFVSII